MSRRNILVTVLGGVVLGLVAYVLFSPEPVEEETAAPASTTTTTVATTTTEPPLPVWEGFEATNTEPQTLSAMVHGPTDVYETPTSSEPIMTLDETTILDTITVLGVVTAPEDGWTEVILPVRPNGSTGWVRSEDLSFYVADSEIVIELAERKLTYVVDGVEVLATDVAIGTDDNPTPTGRYFVTDSVTLADPNSAWGPHALGISARSEFITSFNGGDGQVGIHGTNNPDAIGDNVSLGCVRLPNDMITILYEIVPLGTPVEIQA